MAKAKRITNVRNAHYIKVTKCCASCAHKEIEETGERFCMVTKKMVHPSERCRKWQMAEGLQQAGMSGGVVRNKETKEVIIR